MQILSYITCCLASYVGSRTEKSLNALFHEPLYEFSSYQAYKTVFEPIVDLLLVRNQIAKNKYVPLYISRRFDPQVYGFNQDTSLYHFIISFNKKIDKWKKNSTEVYRKFYNREFQKFMIKNRAKASTVWSTSVSTTSTDLWPLIRNSAIATLNDLQNMLSDSLHSKMKEWRNQVGDAFVKKSQVLNLLTLQDLLQSYNEFFYFESFIYLQRLKNVIKDDLIDLSKTIEKIN